MAAISASVPEDPLAKLLKSEKFQTHFSANSDAYDFEANSDFDDRALVAKPPAFVQFGMNTELYGDVYEKWHNYTISLNENASAVEDEMVQDLEKVIRFMLSGKKYYAINNAEKEFELQYDGLEFFDYYIEKEKGAPIKRSASKLCKDRKDLWRHSAHFKPYPPDQESPDDDKFFNTFRGFQGKYLPGIGVKLSHEEFMEYVKKNDVILAFIRERLCGGDFAWFELIMSWLSFLVQKPTELTEMIVFLATDKFGTGKSSFMTFLTDNVIGCKHATFAQMSDLDSNFNGYMDTSRLVTYEETPGMSMSQKHTRDRYNKLKNYSTAKLIRTQEKNIKGKQVRNICNLVLNTNNVDYAAFIEEGERRIYIPPMIEEIITAWDRFDELIRFYDHPDSGDLFITLLTAWPIKEGFNNPKNRPYSYKYELAKNNSKSPVDKFMTDLLEGELDEQLLDNHAIQRSAVPKGDPTKIFWFIQKRDAYTLYEFWFKQQNYGGRIMIQKDFNRKLDQRVEAGD